MQGKLENLQKIREKNSFCISFFRKNEKYEWKYFLWVLTNLYNMLYNYTDINTLQIEISSPLAEGKNYGKTDKKTNRKRGSVQTFI